MKVLLDTSPISNGHAHRGIGLYTAQLQAHLSKLDGIDVVADAKEKDISIVHYPYFDLFFPTLPLLRPAKKSVVTIHDVIPLEFPDQYKPGIKGSLSFEAQKLALKSVNAVITDSHSSKNSIVKHLGAPEEKIHVVYLAGNPNVEKQSASKVAEAASKHQLPAHYMLYVGDINYNKNLPQLIKSLKFLPTELHLVLLGKNFRKQDIPEWHWIETQIALSDVAGRVKFIPSLGEDTDTELSAIYSAADVYVQPSLAEGFGLPVLEAMQAKTPVVCTNTTSLPEVAGAHAQYCETQAESIAAAVKDVISFPQSKRKKIIDEAFEWSQQFSWKKAAKDTLEVYKKVMQ